MKKALPYFIAFVLIAAFAIWFTHNNQKKTFQEITVEIGEMALGSEAVITVKKDVKVWHWEELKKPYVDALELYFEAGLFGLIERLDYEESYRNLSRATPTGPERYFYQDLTWVSIEYMRLMGKSIEDTLYQHFMDARKNMLAEDLSKHDKSGNCLILESETLAAKINRGEYNEVLYQKYEVVVEIPITHKVSYITSIWVRDYPNRMNEGPEIKKQFKELLPKIKEFKKKYDC